MNTNLKRFGKTLHKESLKKMKGGDSTGLMGVGCPRGCYCCKAHPLYGTGTDKEFCNANDSLLDAWGDAWSGFGYQVTCKYVPYI
jgi:hypothetical protein